jgi:hypothetical protein
VQGSELSQKLLTAGRAILARGRRGRLVGHAGTTFRRPRAGG